MPTLRIYGWCEPTLSLGRFQAAEEVNFDAAVAFRVPVVRRPTGGRGVLHFDEVTYSLTAGIGDGIPRGVATSYAWILRALVSTFQSIGIDASQSKRRQRSRHLSSSACYGSLTPADLSVDVKKLSGSAQVWLEDTVLQHGSLVMTKDVATEAKLLRLDPPQTEELIASTVTISSICSPEPSPQVVRSALIEGFTDTLGVRFEHSSLSDEEHSIAEDIASRFIVVP
ncbi:MAG: lipoate--protein ligase family protein [Actinobacteria bacterium]|nr:lipoate--protein ligase family protein [Actinomycetota bacterium]MCL5887611.1 lipoate--protein ligase family protein [Actinomycetota bacterium]